ncbi:tripartite tricarboxylate transporter TctB family protein [Saccharopolyspora rhizosphaerae]|uniref:Tripartite tricarboxylate transporter TctB family protein n=1 Tax=Saccharopolyspora rhizosphaerae TaxID=2492662 RepID=A0A426K538_9PSEU|nr:tripartite tricarboxylate transporter TctB family protein [Saccharopolyspora rhizosphaerae]RRO20513.1 tripartite tricarboxylate transporter TctB family protein [Saccharopolyspora rhizosphaerae]
MSTDRAQVWLMAGLVLLGAGFAVSAPVYGVFGEQGRIGPGFVPLTTGGLLAVLAAVLLHQQLRTRLPEPSDEPRAGGESQAGVDDFGRTPQQRAWILRRVFVLLPVTVAAVPVVGLVCAFGALVLVISTWLEGRSLLPAVGFSVAAAGVVQVIFAVVLAVPLPTGIFGF